MNVAVNCQTNNKNQRSFGEAAMAFNPIIKYNVVKKVARPKYLFITIGILNLTITMCYILPSATTTTVQEVLSNIQQCARSRAIVMGYLNARHKQ